MFSPIGQADFEPGKVLVALHKECIDTAMASDYSGLVFDGIEMDKAEPLFSAANTDDNDNIGAIVTVHLKSKERSAVISAIERLMRHECVVFAEPDFRVEAHIVPNDPYFELLWGVGAIDGTSAWNYTTGSPDVVVGVIDSGIEHNHPDLRSNIWNIPNGARLRGWDFYNNIGNPPDITGHGTHVAGIIGAVGNNRLGVTGVCWNVKMAALKIGNYFFDVASAIEAISLANRHGIPILNASWGSRYYSLSLKYAIDHYDGLFVASAGNSGSDNDTFPVYPASYDSGNILSVSATTPNHALAYFSNYGAQSVDIAAPGMGIFSTALHGRYSAMNGTSMAAPYVAGAAALLKSYLPALTALEVKNIILSAAERQNELDGKVLTAGTLNLRRMMELAAGPRRTII